ncbi:KEOPS complex subunit Pcc1 [Natronomonas gomsonensis]|uniref:KEOPS complex subunit Pcc1 n=1 Tax=Natronomonas gomsonensis TaxID=1046043 RepID=UPI0015BD7A75
MHDAELVFDYDTPEAAALIADSVGQEIGEIEGDRTTAAVSRDGCRLRIDIDADDLVALRAGLNTWTTLIEVAERSMKAGR